MLCGIGFRTPLKNWVMSCPEQIECLELIAEHFFDDQNKETLEAIVEHYPHFIHGLGLSLGSAEPLDPKIVAQFKAVVERSNPLWISEHVAFTRTSEVDLGHLNPVSPSRSNAIRIAEKTKQLADICGKPVLLENITSFLRLNGDLKETEFLNVICAEAQCQLLLDVTNLYINSRNHQFDPLAWIHEIAPCNISQLHIVGFAQRGDRWHDSHANPIQNELWDLLAEVCQYADIQATIIERDAQFDTAKEELMTDLTKMKELVVHG